MALPLEGIRVLDLTIWQQGPMTSVMLADMGADVIKIEGPEAPDPGRAMLAHAMLPANRPNPYFETHNRNKRGMVLDLKSEQGRAVFYRLVEKADVVVQNFRPGVNKRLKIDYERLARINRRLVYATASGFGLKGPDRGLPALDILAQARGGIMSITGELESPPARTVNGLADQVSAFLLAFGIMVALWQREKTGEGQEVDSSLLGAAIASQAWNINSYLLAGSYAGQPVPRLSRKLSSPLWNQYKGADGKWFVLGMPQLGRYWPIFRRAMEEATGVVLEPEEMSVDWLRMHATELMQLLAKLDELFATRTAREWVALFRGHDLMAEVVQEYPELASDPQVVENEMMVTFEHPTYGPLKMVGTTVNLHKTPGGLRRPAPEFGQHTEEVLLEHGFSWEEIEGLRQQGLIGPKGAKATA